MRAVRVGIVFDRLDDGLDAELIPLEIDEAISLLVAAADVARSEPAAVIASARLLEPLGEFPHRLVALGELLKSVQLREAKGRCEGTKNFKCHGRMKLN